MTKNKSQGQTLPWCVIDISDESFSHGQKYVAFSRPSVFENAAVFCLKQQVENEAITFTNIVYAELLGNE